MVDDSPRHVLDTAQIGGQVPAMSFAEVASLPLREKLQIMEAIWADLSERAELFEIPPEHDSVRGL